MLAELIYFFKGIYTKGRNTILLTYDIYLI